MRKEIVYSLLAFGAVPVVANAAAIDVKAYGQDTQAVTDAGVDLKVGKLVPGKYKITGNVADAKVTVTVTGKDAVEVAAGAAINIDLELTAETDITINLKAEATKTANVSAVLVNLNYDFAEVDNTSTKKNYNAFVTALGKYTYEGKDADVVAAYDKIGKVFDDIKAAKADDGYKIYSDNELWLGDDSKTLKALQTEIDTEALAAIKKEIAKLAKELEDEFAKDAITKDYNDLTTRGKEKVDEEEPTFAGVKQAIADFKAQTESVDVTAIKKDIADLTTEIAAQKALDEASNTAYNEVLANITAAQEAYTAANNALQEALDGEDYAKLLSEGSKALADEAIKLANVKKALEESKKAGTVATDRLNSMSTDGTVTQGFDAQIADAKSAISSIQSTFEGYGTTLKGALAKLDTEKESLKTVSEAADVKAALDAKDPQAVKAQTAAQDLIDALAKKIADNATSAENAAGNPAITDLDITEDVTAIDEAIAKLKASVTNFTAYNAAIEAIDAAQEAIDGILAAVKKEAETKKLDAKDYNPETFIAGAIADLNDALASGGDDELNKAAVEAAYAEGTAADISADAVTFANGVEAEATTLQTNGIAAVDDMAAALETYNANQESLTKRDGEIKELAPDVYEEQYAPKVAKIQDKIDDQKEAIDEALAAEADDTHTLWENHYALVDALSVADLQSDIDALGDDAAVKAAQKAYEDAVEATAAAALSTAVDNTYDAMKERIDAVKDDAAIYGKANADLQTAKTAAQKALDDAMDGKAKGDVSGKTSAELSAIAKAIEALGTGDGVVAKLEADAKAAADKVKAQNDAKTAADKAVAAVEEELTKAKAAKDTEYKDQTIDWTDIEADIADVKTKIADERTNEDLTEADYKADLEKISAAIKKAKDDAVAVQQNADAAAALNKLADDVQTAITAAGTDYVDATKGDPAAGSIEAYANLVDASKDGSFQKQLDDIKAEITKAITDKKVAEQKAAIEKKLNDLKAEAEGLAAKAKANLDAKTAQETALTKANKTWDDVSLELVSNNESSQLPVLQEELTKLKDDLKAYKEQIQKDYEAGKSASNDLKAAIEKTEKAITDVLAKSKEGYDEQITADNNGMWEKFQEELQAAQAEYQDAAKTVADYSSVRSTTLTSVIATVKTESDALNAQLTSFYEDQEDLYNRALEVYQATTSPTVYDKDSSFVKEARDLAATVKDLKTNYVDAIRDKVANVTDGLVKATEDAEGNISYSGTYPSAVEAAKTVVRGYWDYKEYLVAADDADAEALAAVEAQRVAALNELFGSLDQLIATIADAKKNPDLKVLDEYLLKAQDATTGINATIAKVKNEEAYSALNKNLLEVEEAAAALTDDNSGSVEALLETIATLRENIENDLTNGNEAANYDSYKTQIEDLKTQTAAQDVEAAFEKFMAEYNEIQEALDAAKEFASQFAVYDQILGSSSTSNTLEYVQNYINIRKNWAENDKNYSSATNQNKVSWINYDASSLNKAARLSQIENIIGMNLFNKELSWIADVMKDVDAQYVQYAADFSEENQESVLAFKAQIDDLKDRIDALPELDDEGNPNYDPETLLPYEQEVAELITAMTAANDAEANADALATLEEDLAKAEEALAALDNYEVSEFDNITATYFVDEDGVYHWGLKKTDAINEAKTEIEESIAALKEQIASKKDNVLPYASTIGNSIQSINDAVAALLDDAAISQKALDKQRDDARQAAEDVVNELAELAQLVADTKATVEGFEDVDTDYTNQLYRLEQSIAEAQEAVNAKIADGSYTTADKPTSVISQTRSGAYNILGQAAKAQLQAEVKELQAAFAEVNKGSSSDYTIQDWSEVNTEYNAVSSAISTINSTVNSLGTGYSTDSETGEYYSPAYRALQGDVDEDGNATGVRADIAAAYEAIEELKALIAEKKLFEDEVEDPATADFNGDGNVTVSDYGLLLQAVLSGATDSKYDLSGDGNVDILDINKWVELFRKTAAAPATARGAQKSDVATVQVSQQDGVTRLAVMLTSDDVYRGVQLDVEGAQVVGVSATDRAAEMGLYSNVMANGATRVLLTSLNMRTIAAGEGAVLYIDVMGQANLTNVKFVDALGQLVEFNLSTGEATAINGVSTNPGIMERIYNMGGRVMDSLKKGINIIRNADGTTRKVVVK